jgi:hypothetical protein
MTIDERIEALTHTLELQAGMQVDAENRQAEADKRHDEVDKRQAEAEKRHVEAEKRHDEALARIDRRLDRAIRLGVQDARRQRQRNLEFDEKMTQLAAAQVVTEEKLQGLIDALRGRGNGRH